MFSIEQVGQIEDDVQKVLIAERNNYADVYDTVEKYIGNFSGDETIYLGGSYGVNLLFKRPRELNDYNYVLYSQKAFVQANELTNLIAAGQDYSKGGKIVTLVTKLPYKRYEIVVDNRTLVSMYHLQPLQGLDSLILPIKEKSELGYTLTILSPEVYLLNCYHTLCSPQEVGSWEQALRDETKLFQLMNHRLNDLFNAVLIGGSNNFLGGKEEQKESNDETKKQKKEQKENKKIDYKMVEQKLLRDVIDNNEEVIMVGEHAITIINDRNFLNLSDWQPTKLISVIGNLQQITERVKKVFPDNSITQQSKLVPILEDFRLERGVIKLDDKEVMYVYSASQYDCIPYNVVSAKKSKIRIGSPFVLMRFLLVDLWMVRWIHHIKMIDDVFAKTRIKNIVKVIVSLRTKLQDPKIDIKTMSVSSDTLLGTKIITKLPTNIKDSYFGDESELGLLGKKYMGQYISEYLAVKLLLAQSDKKFPPYYPQRHLLEHGNYRAINSHSKTKST